VQLLKVELPTLSASVKRFAAAPPTTVEQFSNTEPDRLADCSAPPGPTAYSAPLVLFTDTLRNVLDETVSSDTRSCTAPSLLCRSEKAQDDMVSWEPFMAIWAQLSEPSAVQSEKVEPLTSSTAVATDKAAPPPLKVEQSWKLEPEMVVFCSVPLGSIADTAPLESHTRRRLNTHDDTLRDDAPATCTMLSTLCTSEKTESAMLS
jgi:hypothetical protein